jgi:hypothetical protein
MDQHLFILCDTREDVKNVWLWCYEHDYVGNIPLESYLDSFECMMKQDYTVKPLMMCVDLREGKGLHFIFDQSNDPIDDIPKEDLHNEVLKFQREHAIHASDIDFDFLNVRR